MTSIDVVLNTLQMQRMPRRPKLEPRMAAKKDRTVKNIKEARKALVDRAVQPQSLSQYEARFSRMEIFRKEVGEGTWSADLFTRWLWQMKDANYKGSEGYRAALLHCLEARGVQADFLRSHHILKMSQGFALQNKLKGKAIGTITLSMLCQLCDWLRGKQEQELAVLASVIFHTQGRGEEVIRMRKGDVQAEDSKGMYLWYIRNDKRCKRDSRFTKSTEKLIPRNIASLIRIIGSDKAPGEKLFEQREGYSLSKLSERIRQASAELGWPEGVRFGGAHGLRHGGSRLLAERARVAVATGMANQARDTLAHYTRSNAARK